MLVASPEIQHDGSTVPHEGKASPVWRPTRASCITSRGDLFPRAATWMQPDVPRANYGELTVFARKRGLCWSTGGDSECRHQTANRD
jgi:hypothetical protein